MPRSKTARFPRRRQFIQKMSICGCPRHAVRASPGSRPKRNPGPGTRPHLTGGQFRMHDTQMHVIECPGSGRNCGDRQNARRAELNFLSIADATRLELASSVACLPGRAGMTMVMGGLQ
jgi:hypothetical protein